MFIFDVPVSVAYHLVSGLAGAGIGAAGAIVLFTLAVRLVLVPLSVAAARGERARTRLAPQVRRLQQRHRQDPQRMRQEIAGLYGAKGVSPAAGCLPALAQAPFFLVMYRLFVSATVAGHQNLLLGHTLLGTQLGQNWIGTLTAGGVFGASSLVFLGLFAVLAAVAWVAARRLQGPLVVRLIPYGTVVAAAFVPLAAGLYLLTTTAWTAGERMLVRA